MGLLWRSLVHLLKESPEEHCYQTWLILFKSKPITQQLKFKKKLWGKAVGSHLQNSIFRFSPARTSASHNKKITRKWRIPNPLVLCLNNRLTIILELSFPPRIKYGAGLSSPEWQHCKIIADTPRYLVLEAWDNMESNHKSNAWKRDSFFKPLILDSKPVISLLL